MLKKTITYTDYNGLKRTEDHYFNLSKAELVEWQASTSGTLTEILSGIVASNDMPNIMKTFKDLIKRSYGVKSEDGKFFDKSQTISNRFLNSAAYEVMFMELFTTEGASADFINGIIPADLKEQLDLMSAN